MPSKQKGTGDRKGDANNKKEKKYEPATPPTRVGKKQRKQKGPEAAACLPVVTPTTKCKLRLLKLDRVKDYLLMEEEFVAGQERLKPQEDKNEEDWSKVDDLRGSPMSVGNFNRTMQFFLDALPSPGLTHLKVQLCRVAKSWDSEGAPDFQHYRGVEGRARSPGIKLGRGTRRSSLNLQPKQTTKWLVHIRKHPWVLGQAMGTLTHKTQHGPDSGEITTFPHIVFSATLRQGYIQMALFPGTPKLESRNCPGCSPGTLGAHNSRLQSLIATRSKPKL